MLKRILFYCAILIIVICFSDRAIYAQWQIQYDQEANKTMHLGGNTLRGNFTTEPACRNYWASRPAYERAHSRCVQTGTMSSGMYGGSNNFAQNVAANMFGNILQGVFNPPAQPLVDNAAQAQAQAKAIELQKKQNLKKWQDFQTKQKVKQYAQERAKKKQGEELFSQMDTFGSNNSLELESFDSKEGQGEGGPDVLEMQLLSAGKYDTSALSPLNRLRAANYFSQKALEAMSKDDNVSARYFSLQAEKVMAGEMVDEQYDLSSLSNIPEPPIPTRVDEQRQGFSDYNDYLKKDIDIKLNRADKAKKQIQEQQQKAAQDIVKFGDKSRKTKDIQEKQKYDELVSKAKQALVDAKNSTKELEKIKRELIKKQEKLNNQIG